MNWTLFLVEVPKNVIKGETLTKRMVSVSLSVSLSLSRDNYTTFIGLYEATIDMA